eukprot:SAG31_NODE_128_length_23532_cov_21.204754_10_plen_73_part_00
MQALFLAERAKQFEQQSKTSVQTATGDRTTSVSTNAAASQRNARPPKKTGGFLSALKSQVSSRQQYHYYIYT